MTTMSASITCTGCNHAYADTALFCPNCGRPKVRETTSDPLVGKLLGERFQVQEQIGQGASGTIYRAEHVTLRRKVAIKVLHQELSRDDLAVERFRREATTVAEIDNEHIVEIHDFGRTPDGRLYLAMELLEGETLDTVLVREQTLSVERAADILIQLGEALMEAHAIGYVHRDLRPRNVYLAVRRGKANFVKLLDFGLSKLVETDAHAASTSLGMTFGDPRYMSPEQARGDRIDRRADIYQLGCVAYEMLTGAPPFSGNRVFDILTKQVSEVPAPLPTKRPGVPIWMEAAVARMLAKDPDNRFATTTRMVEALRRGLDTGEVMEDEIARRRESIPPPSVSRVMQKLGVMAEQDRPAERPAAEKPAEKPAAEKPAERPAAAKPAAEPSRKRTGTPQVGVPVAGPPVAGPPVAGPPAAAVAGAIHRPTEPTRTPVVEPTVIPSPSTKIETPKAAEPAKSAASSSSSSMRRDGSVESSSWFDEGEQATKNADLAKHSPSMTDIGFDEPATRRRWPIVVGILGVCAAAGLAIAMFATGGSSAAKPNAPVAAAEQQPPPPPSIPANIPQSTIIGAQGSDAQGSDAPAGSAVAAGSAGSTEPAPISPLATTAVKSPATPHDTAHSHDHDRHADDGGSFDLGVDDSSRRHPTATPPAPTPPAPTPPPTPVVVKQTPPAPPKNGVSGTDAPVDPYGAAPNPTDGAPADKQADFYANMGEQQLASSDVAGAAASFQKAAQLDPKSAGAAIGMGEVALRQGLFGDAISHLRRALRFAPKSSKVYTLLGEAYLDSGQNASAAENYKKALQLDPDNAKAREGYMTASSKVPPPSDDD